MECEDLAAQLTDFLEGVLPEADEIAALEHLSTCESCELVLAETRQVVELAHDHGRAPLTNNDRHRLLTNLLNEIAE